MNDYDVQDRMMQIYRRRAAMGGCPPKYDDLFGDGVMAGGARKKGSKNKKNKNNLRAAHENPWNAFLCAYSAAYDLDLKEAMSRASPAYKKWKETGQYPVKMREAGYKASYASVHKKPVAKKKPAKKRSASKAPKKSVGKRGRPMKNVRVSQKVLDTLGISKAQFDKLRVSRAKKKRMGKRYMTRTKNGACFKEDAKGKYYINKNYDCVKYKKKT